MGLFSSKSAEEIHGDKIKEFLFEGEILEHVYGLVVDFVALTNKRMIFVDKSVFSKETGVISVPYSKIEKIAIVKDKFWSLSDKIEVTTRSDKHELKLLQGKNEGLKFYTTLSKYICE